MNIRHERGAVAPLIALLLFVIIICVALVVDLGRVHSVKAELQRTVDAAALAGAKYLPDDDNIDNIVIASINDSRVDGQTFLELVNEGRGAIERIEAGTWNTKLTDSSGNILTTEDRFLPAPTTNAVYVKARVDVDHIFFFFTDNTEVYADAIAIDLTREPTIPLAVISCVPPSGPQAGSLTACGIATYSFSSNTNTAGWTGLTWGGTNGASQQDIQKFVSDPKAFQNFNEIVKALNERPVVNNQPLPYDEDYEGCTGNISTEGNVTGNINCGLGGDFGNRIAPTAPGAGDPLTRYNQLPRYITLSDEERKAFADLISMDGVLFQGYDPANPDDYLDNLSNETFAEYQVRLQDLFNAPVEDTAYGDARFNLAEFIIQTKDVNDNDGDGSKNDNIYVPNFTRIVDYLGYPPVNATTGSMVSVMGSLLDLVAPNEEGVKKDIPFDNTWTGDYYPFNEAGKLTSGASGESLLFTMPVIFAGSCAGFDATALAAASANVELYYVGLANFLVTRIFKGGDCYETVTPVTLEASMPGDCSLAEAQNHTPTLVGGTSYSCPVSYNESPIAFEGLVRPPGLGEDEGGSAKKLVLVE